MATKSVNKTTKQSKNNKIYQACQEALKIKKDYPDYSDQDVMKIIMDLY